MKYVQQKSTAVQVGLWVFVLLSTTPDVESRLFKIFTIDDTFQSNFLRDLKKNFCKVVDLKRITLKQLYLYVIRLIR